MGWVTAKGDPMQKTIEGRAEFAGVGVHGGAPVTAIVEPAEAGAGVTFIRTDVEEGRDGRIPARFDHVADTRLCTVLANADGVTISTIEHLMAALAGVGITNATIRVDGPEIPIMDGSSAPFVRGLMRAGLRAQEARLKVWRIHKTIEVSQNGKLARLEPCDRFEMSFDIDFDAEAIGKQSRSMRMVNGAFVEKLARARTFGMLSDVEKLRSMGLARGGSLDNAIVVDGAKVLNRDGLRYQDEFVRHKMLDAVGDLALAGAPIVGRYRGVCAGHEMTNLLLRKLFATPGAATLEVARDPSVTGLGVLASSAGKNAQAAA